MFFLLSFILSRLKREELKKQGLPSYERMLLMLEDQLLILDLAFDLDLMKENYSIY